MATERKMCVRCGMPGHRSSQCRQPTLELIGGDHPGPLFIPVKRAGAKPPMRSTNRDRLLKRRTPDWSDTALTRDIYLLARIYTRHTGTRYSVDHSVPVNHDLVSGLHTPANLTIAPLADNMRKGNRHWPDMPALQGEMFS